MHVIILTATWINLRRIAKYLHGVLFIFIVCIPARCILHVNVLSYLKISVRCNINTLKSTEDIQYSSWRSLWIWLKTSLCLCDSSWRVDDIDIMNVFLGGARAGSAPALIRACTCLHIYKYTSHYLLYIVFIVADASVGKDCINLHEFLSVSKYVIYTNCNIVSTEKKIIVIVIVLHVGIVVRVFILFAGWPNLSCQTNYLISD